MSEFRYDLGGLDAPVQMPNGWLRVDGYVTKVGVFEYINADGSKRRELRPDDEVNASLPSFGMVPVTDGHPDVVLDSTNTAKYQKGTVSEVIRRDGDAVRATMLITDGALAAKMRAGKRGLSCGYEVDLDRTSGNHPVYGRYDAIQRNIRGNHIAAGIDLGRAGSIARVRMDAATQVEGAREDVGGKTKHGKDGRFVGGAGHSVEQKTEHGAKREHGHDPGGWRELDAHVAEHGLVKHAASDHHGPTTDGSHAPVTDHLGSSEHGSYHYKTRERSGSGANRGHDLFFTHRESGQSVHLGHESDLMDARGTMVAHDKSLSKHVKKDSTDHVPALQATGRTIGVEMNEEMKAVMADASAQKARADALESSLSDERARADAAEGACDALKTQLIEAMATIRTDGPAVSDLENRVKVLTMQVGALKEDLEVANSPARRRADVRSRVKLEAAGAVVFGQKFNADTMDDVEIMHAVLEKLHGSVPKDRSEEYLRARFDAAVDGYFAGEAALARARDAMRDAVRTDEKAKADSRTARERMVDYNRNRTREEK